ncbi:hypothetical protein LSH36_119g00017 [Paralvinella palmiformis]|uniref:Uncharacterized protein n=1 Tax=Paralvinella palmiformis TaxID=53620 RepID=A0AAD9JY41_9ANNE|nr:hypothetical protein LSH36_119g00017 [Paralvinella palmiformis]
MYGLGIRTNNDVEGWHRLNKRGRHHMPFYMLITLLHDEARLVHLQVRLVSEEKLKRHQERKYQKFQKRIFKYWGEYEHGIRSAFQLLRAFSHYMDLCKFNYTPPASGSVVTAAASSRTLVTTAEIHQSSTEPALSAIKGPPALRKRRRPKDLEKMMIGLPFKRQRFNQLSYARRPFAEKKMFTLTSLVGEERDSAGLQEGSKLQTTDLRVSFSSSLLEECISINSVKEMFTPAAWRQVKPMVSALKEHPLWN